MTSMRSNHGLNEIKSWLQFDQIMASKKIHIIATMRSNYDPNKIINDLNEINLLTEQYRGQLIVLLDHSLDDINKNRIVVLKLLLPALD